MIEIIRSVMQAGHEMDLGNLVVLFGLMGSLVTPLVLSARKMDKR